MDIPEHLLPLRFPRAEIERTLRLIRVKPGTTIDMVMDPDFWVHSGQHLRIDDKLEVLAADGSFEVELRCVAVDVRGYWAQMRLLTWWPRNLAVRPEWIESKAAGETPPQTGPDPQGYLVEWAGPVHKWRIINRAGEIVGKGFVTQEDAASEVARIKREKIAA
jgi:hypothetical protein